MRKSSVLLVLSLCLTTVLIAFSLPHKALADTSINGVVSDDQLRMRINVQYLNRDDPDTPITETDLQGLTELNLTGMGDIDDWSWLAYCTNLMSLDLGNTNFSDTSLIQAKSLTHLTLSATPLNSLQELHTLNNLRVLRISELLDPDNPDEERETEVDISFLKYMTQLEELEIFELHLADSEPLSHLVNLKTLVANGTKNLQAEHLGTLVSLEHLHVNEADLKSLDFVRNMIHLQELEAHQNNFSDLSPLAGLMELKILQINQNPIVQLSPISQLIQLETLDVSKTSTTSEHDKITDITPLTNLKNLKVLNLDYNALKSVQDLSALSQLENLRLNGNYLSNLQGLETLYALRSLEVASNETLTSIEAIAPLTQLESFIFSRTAVEDISSVKDLYLGGMFSFIGQDINITHVISRDKLHQGEYSIPLPSGHNISYETVDPAIRDVITYRDGSLIIPESLRNNEGFDITFESNFERSYGRSYAGVIHIRFVDSHDTSINTTHEDTSDTGGDHTQKNTSDALSQSQTAHRKIPATGDLNISIISIISLLLGGGAVLSSRRI